MEEASGDCLQGFLVFLLASPLPAVPISKTTQPQPRDWVHYLGLVTPNICFCVCWSFNKERIGSYALH